MGVFDEKFKFSRFVSAKIIAQQIIAFDEKLKAIKRGFLNLTLKISH